MLLKYIPDTIKDMVKQSLALRAKKSGKREAGNLPAQAGVKLDATLEELFEASAHLGHRPERWNPKIAPYLFGVHEGVHIFDLDKTLVLLNQAMDELRHRAAEGQTFLFVGTKQQAQEAIKTTAQGLGMPYITQRFIGGLFTNFGQIKKSIDKMGQMKKTQEAGEYNEFTKKERLLIAREITRLERVFGGVAGLEKLPDLVIVVDTKKERTVVAEARRIGMPIMAIVDTNSDPTLIDYPIAANDDSIKSVGYIIGKLGEAVKEGLKNRKVEKVEQVEQVSA